MDHDHLLPAGKSAYISEDEEEQIAQHPIRRHRKHISRSDPFPWTAVLVHGSIFFTYTAILSLFMAWRNALWTHGLIAYVPFTPEPQAMIFEHEHSVYVGDPTPELEDAWRRLLRNTNVRITEAEISNIPDRKDNGVALPDGGYYATLNTYHNLHCVKRLHHYMYEDHYFPNISRSQKAANKFHSHHCLDMLRQSVMCQADMQLLTMRWLPHSRVPRANWTAPHQCVNWNQVEEWAGSRRIENLMDPGYLNHPTLGPAYPDGRGSVIGEAEHSD